MRYFILDTNFIFIQLRENARLQHTVDEYRMDDDDAVLLVSVVTIAELYALAERNKWGEKRLATLQAFLQRLYSVDIQRTNQALLEAYAYIDARSQSIGRKMSKNDLWIAATAAVAKATLVTADADFDHLKEYIKIIKT